MLHGQSPFNPSAVKSQTYDGVPTVGTFITQQTDGWRGRSCNATVVPSPQHNLVVTAAHCLASYDGAHGMRFVPMWHDGKEPYGSFPLIPGRTWAPTDYIRGRSGYTKERWDLDAVFIQVGRNAKGQNVQDAVGGADPIDFSAPPSNDTVMIGYPARLKYPLHCEAKSSPAFEKYQQIACNGYTGGTSGAPWFTDWNAKTDTGRLIGVLGGYMRGGTSNDLEYGTRFTPELEKLYHDAQYNVPQKSVPGLGTGAEWSKARSIDTGDFFGGRRERSDDLLARYADGSVRIYAGNREKPYGWGGGIRPGVTVQTANRTWAQAKDVTVGDFGGRGNHNDVLLLTRDGRLLVYRNVTAAHGLGRPVQLQGPNRTWAQARAMTAGAFGTSGPSHAMDQLVVVGPDGSVTQYTGIGTRNGAAALHTGVPLAGPSAKWAAVKDLTTAEVTANGSAKKHIGQGVMAAFRNGEIDMYRGTDVLTPDAVLATPGREKSHLRSLAGGTWIGLAPGGHIRDDVAMLWDNGALVMHQNSNLRGFVREFQLVAPAKPDF
ncbi:trypsin-like serine peptidase [Mangrovactinospora gilvigrisea]|nr:hypothetical protein [Mangrovactinospora gilvigrisea]